MIDPRLKKIADHFGFGHQTEKAVEEMAELIVAIKHLKKKDTTDAYIVNFVEELADVKIMIDQLIYLTELGAPTDFNVRAEVERKIERTLRRIEDNHPDAITARKYAEGDPETVKKLGIFD